MAFERFGNWEPQRENWLAPFKRLDLRLLVDAEDECAIR